jgi:hypothetical protein
VRLELAPCDISFILSSSDCWIAPSGEGVLLPRPPVIVRQSSGGGVADILGIPIRERGGRHFVEVPEPGP